MRRFLSSAATVLALAAPAWAQYPAPAGYPIQGYQPGMYAGGFTPPDMLPPVSVPPGGMPPMGMPPMGAPMGPGSPPATVADPAGFPFDPCTACVDPRAPRYVRAIVQNERWVRADWMLWQMRDQPVPPLIVTGNPTAPGAGIPGGGNSVVLVGPRRDLGSFNGIRAAVGQWFDQDGELGGEITGFVFGREGSADFFQGSATRPLSVPVLGSNGMLGVYDFSFPGRFTGSLGLRTATQLWGAEGHLLRRLYGDGCLSVDAQFGYRYLQLNERLELFGRAQSAGAVATFNGAGLPGGVLVTTSDSFRACTEFHGVQFGTRGEYRRDMFTVSPYGKFGVGVNLQTLRVGGNTQASGFGITRTSPGGLRGLGTNIGRDTNTDFSMIAETGIEVGVQVTKNLSVRVGYNLLFWSDVLRPANVIDPIVTLSQVPIDPSFNPAAPATRPTTVFRSSDFLAHGLVVGLMLDW